MKTTTRELPDKSGNFHTIYDMSTSLGMVVSITALGASIQKIAITGKDGSSRPITLGFDDITQYERCVCYAGATLGPNAGRIRGARLPINQHVHHLTQNDQDSQLHGGINSLSAWLWQVQSFSCGLESASILLSARQPDGLDGYPGNRIYYTRYTLEDTNWLTIEYRAETDSPTYINMSNHTYWNLSGNFSRTALEQELQIFANNVCINNKNHLPEDIVPAADTAFDFRRIRQIKSAASACDFLSQEQLEIGKGYNNAYILNKNHAFRTLRSVNHTTPLKKACTLRDPETGLTLKMLTDAPALVLYSGGFLPSSLPLHHGAFSSPSCAIALEAQDIPDVMNILPANYRLTTPDRPFQRTIRFHI